LIVFNLYGCRALIDTASTRVKNMKINTMNINEITVAPERFQVRADDIDKRDMTITQLRQILKRFAPEMVQCELFDLEFGLSQDTAARRNLVKLAAECRRAIKAFEVLEKAGTKITGSMKKGLSGLIERAREYEHEILRFDCRARGDDDPGTYKRNNRKQIKVV